ncbi:GNAT family N-acetyltransferase [Lichenicoccus sp.]|uniref:GNAT family N-acetyltransferase n=1 Tax=Lichenicoccus sp. TaxID=2781899 RepID=UPI003D0F22F3
MMCDGLSLRKATLADRETIYRIHVDSTTALCGTHYSKEQLAGWFEGRSLNDYTGAIEWGGDWIAYLDQEPVGFIEFFTKTISMLYVDSRYAGQGIGRRRLQFALSEMPGEKGRISLEALLNAVPFYERFGFQRIGEGEMRRKSGLVIKTVLMERLSGQADCPPGYAMTS